MSSSADWPYPAERIQLLAMSWLLEPDAARLDALSQLSEMPAAIASINPTNAALEYSQIILQQVPPYASLFLSEDGMLNGPVTGQVLEEYARHGFEIKREWRAGTGDHLGVELHFLAHLILTSPSSAQSFISNHLLSWAPVCCLAIERNRQARLYAAIARATRRLLLECSTNGSP